MTTRIAPALTPEAWAAPPSFEPYSAHIDDASGDLVLVGPDGNAWRIKARHAHAAMALHGQPFGFTHEDVKALRIVAGYARLNLELDVDSESYIVERAADRIEALLPPEATHGR